MTKQLPSRWWHLLSVVIFFAGAVATPITTVFLLMNQLSSGEDFIVPGTHLIKIEKPGKYVVWNIVSEFRDGIQRAYSEKLPNGTRIRITNSIGKEIPTTGDMSCTETSGNTTRSLICSFEVSEIGSYSIIVDEISEKRPLMVRQSMAARLVWLFVLCGIVSILGWTVPILISVLVETKRHSAKKEITNQMQRTMLITPPPLM